MDRTEAVRRLKQLEGQDLVALAKQYHVTVRRDQRFNKGWAGHVLERYLGLPVNTAQAPNFGSWELKLVSLRYMADGSIGVKETMAITMIDPYNVVRTPFEDSHLLNKLRKAIVCGRLFESTLEPRSILRIVSTFDLSDPELYETVRRDYEEVRSRILSNGFESLTGAMGKLVQPRTKGRGHGSTTRAFYARKEFVARILGI